MEARAPTFSLLGLRPAHESLTAMKPCGYGKNAECANDLVTILTFRAAVAAIRKRAFGYKQARVRRHWCDYRRRGEAMLRSEHRISRGGRRRRW